MVAVPQVYRLGDRTQRSAVVSQRAVVQEGRGSEPVIRLALTDLGSDYGCFAEHGHLTYNPLNWLLLHGLSQEITLDISLTETSRFTRATGSVHH